MSQYGSMSLCLHNSKPLKKTSLKKVLVLEGKTDLPATIVEIDNKDLYIDKRS
jgi:hypothetical protein